MDAASDRPAHALHCTRRTLAAAEVIELSREEEVAALLATKALGLEIAGVDMLQSDRGPLILEVNSSPGLEGIETATGHDIAGEIIAYVEGQVVG